jgi:hypothetical protein
MRNRGCWWWRRSRQGAAPSVEDLLSEAAVRFDFSEYTDVNDMVDVNGGWGPLDIQSADVDTEFTVDGLHVTTTGAAANGSTFTMRKLDDLTDGPMFFGPDGLTGVMVVDSPAVRVETLANVARFTVVCDDDNDSAPDLAATWQIHSVDAGAATDKYTTRVHNSPPGGALIVDRQNIVAETTPLDTTGRFIAIWRVDTAGEEVTVRLVAPDSDFAATDAMSDPPLFADTPVNVDAMNISQQLADGVYVEWLGWNRALSPAEVDALVAHFQS